MKSTTNRIDWSTVLVNKKVIDAYKRFATGTSTASEVSRELRNTPFATQFNSLVRARGTERARDAARLALSRRSK